MERLRDLITKIGLSELINCTLVKAGVRNAFLIQPADYDETYSNDPISASKLLTIKVEFPELKQSQIRGEILISKRRYSEANITNNGLMGEALGYPCAKEFDYTLNNPDESRVAIYINANLLPGYNEDSVQILAYVCRNDRTYQTAVSMAADFEKVLKSDPLLGRIVQTVVAEKKLIATVKSLINKLLSNSVLSREESDEILNYIWNLGLDNANEFKYNLKNPVQRGIVIGLLSVYDNNPIEPFYPLQYRKEQKDVDRITEAWGKELKRIFATKVNGGSKTRKQRKL